MQDDTFQLEREGKVYSSLFDKEGKERLYISLLKSQTMPGSLIETEKLHRVLK